MNEQYKNRLRKRAQAPEPLPNLGGAPSLDDDVDVYWPEYQRYFRGTLVEQAPPSPFEFFIHYEDDDYQQTDLNAVRWHYAQGSYSSKKACCKRDQDRLQAYDFLPGDLLKYIVHLPVIAHAGKETTATSERTEKKRRVNPVRKARNRTGARQETEEGCTRSEGVSDRSICSSGFISQPVSERSSQQVTTLEQSIRWAQDAPFDERGKETRNSSTPESSRGILEGGKFCEEPKLPAVKNLHPKAHWRKLLLRHYTSSGSSIQGK